MNKVTLSVAALAAISVPAQMQAADMTPDQIQEENGKRFEAIHALISDAIRTVETNCPDVCDKFKIELSAELNKYEANKDSEEILIPTAEEVQPTVFEILTRANQAQALYAYSKDVNEAFGILKQNLADAIDETDKYKEAGPSRKTQLEAISLEQISAAIESAIDDKSIADSEVKEGLIKQIDDVQGNIDTIMKDIADYDEIRKQNIIDYNFVVDAAAEAKANYQKEVQKVINNLPGEPEVYGDWQAEALKTLREAYNTILDAEASNENAFNNDPEKAEENASSVVKANIEAINNAKANFADSDGNGGIYANKYQALKEAQEDLKATKLGETYGTGKLTKDINDLESSLSDNKVSSQADAIAEIRSEISDLETKIQESYKVHELADDSYSTDIDKIAQKISTLSQNCEALKANYTNWTTMRNEIFVGDNSIKGQYDAALAKAQETVKVTVADGEEMTYVANDHMSDQNTNITEALDVLDKNIKDTYNEDLPATDYKVRGTYETDKTSAKNLVDDYKTWTEDATTAFKNATETIKEAKTALAELKATVGNDVNVTVDAASTDKAENLSKDTYGSRITKLEGEIEEIVTAIETANNEEGSEHNRLMQIAATKTYTSVATIKANFTPNKNAYDRLVKIDAAEKIVKQAKDLVAISTDKLSQAEQALVDGNFHKDKILPTITDLQVKVTAASKSIPDWDDTTTDDDKFKASAEVIAALSVVNDNLDKISGEIDAVLTKALTAQKNYNNYSDLAEKTNATTSDIAKAIVDATTAVDSYDAKAYWVEVLDGYTKTLADYNTAVENDYKSEDMPLADDAKYNGHISKLNALLANVKAVAGNALDNETFRTTLNESLNNLQASWKEVYDYISTTDETTKKTDWISTLEGKQNEIYELVKTVNTDYMNGLAKKNYETLSQQINTLSGAIDQVKIDQQTNYSSAVKADNENQHVTLFLNGAYLEAEKAFTEAVAKLNKLASLQNDGVKKALELLSSTHAAIYANAPKLSELKEAERTAYLEYDVENPTTIYSAADWINAANDIKADINENLNTYVNEVNKAALDAYKVTLVGKDGNGGAKKEIEDAMNSVAKYNTETLPESLIKLNEDITNACSNIAVDDKGYPKYENFAEDLDIWLNSIDSYKKVIPAALAEAAANEYVFRYEAATTQKDKDIDDIKALEGITSTQKDDYIGQLNQTFAETVTAAEEEYNNLEEVTVENVAPILEKIAGFYADGSDRSQAYNEALTASENNEALNDLVAYCNDNVLPAIDQFKADALALFTMHYEKSTAPAAVENLYTVVNTTIGNAQNDDELASKGDEYKNALNPKLQQSDLQIALDNAKKVIITSEVTALTEQVKLIKEQYNNAINNDDNTVSSDLMKGYAQKINDYENVDLLKDYLGIDYEEARTELLNLEASMAATYQELAKLSDAAAYDAAIAEIDEVIATTEGQLQSVESMVNEFSQLIKEFGVELDALNGSFDALKADYAAKVEAGTVLFYKENLVSDIKKFQPEIEEFATGELKERYDALVENRGAYGAIAGNMARYESLFEEYKAIADTYTYEGYIYDVTSDEQVPFRATVEARILKKYDEQIAEIKEKNENTELKYSDIQKYTSLESDIYDYLRTATYYEAEGQINNTGSKLETVAIDVKKYGPKTYQTLLEAKAAIDASLVNAAKYNQDAYDDNNIYNDIDGNDVSYITPDYSEPMPMRCPYMDEAWPTIKSKLASILEEIDAFAQEVEDKQFLLGDANHDGNIDVRDYQVVRNWILTAKTFAEIDEEKAFGGDVNSDKRFNVADLTCISNLIFDPDFVIPNAAAASARARVMGAAEDKITLATESEETTIFGKTVRLAVNLDNVEAFTAGQMDIILPQGMKLAGQSLSSRANGHEVLANEISNGTFRLLVSTVENSEFNGRNGALIYLDVEVGSDFNGGNISIDEVVFSDAQGKSYYLTNNGPIVPTGIDGIEAATVKERIYSVGGQMMKAVKKGINIIVGENNKTQKVVK